MEEKDIQHFKEKLETEKNLLLDELRGLGIENPKDHDWGAILPPIEGADKADPNIAADRFEDFGERSSQLGELELRFREIEAALLRIENGTYGICEDKNEQISIARLEANPAARTCDVHSDIK